MKVARASLVAAALLALVVAPAPRADAWASTGNETVAAIAWPALSAATRAKVVADLRATKALVVGEGAAQTNVLALLLEGLPAGDDADRHVFVRAATFPDMVRTGPFQALHRRTWHFVNHPIGPGAAKAAKPDDDPASRPADLETMNVVQALAWNLERAEKAERPEERGLALCWVLHLVGDIHQPLHCVSWFSDDFPEGDRGGNLLLVRRGTASNNERLHFVWDFALGADASAARIRQLAEIVGAPKAQTFTPAEQSSRDLRAWAIEGRDLALHEVYLDGAVKGSPVSASAPAEEARRRESAADAPILPADYAERVSRVATRRIGLAGVRLAALLDERIR